MISKVWRIIAALCVAAAIILFAVSCYSSSVRQHRPLGFMQPERAVSVGVKEASDFDGIHPTSEAPSFSFEVHEDLHWTIGFVLPVSVPDEETARRLPAVYVLMPKAASNCVPGSMIAYKPDGTIEKGVGFNSRIQKVAETDDNQVYEVHASPNIWGMKDPQTGIQSARYEIFCESDSPATTSAGFDAANFELVYLPTAAKNFGLVPGLPGFPAKFVMTYRAFVDDHNESDDVGLRAEQLVPQPFSSHSDAAFFWDITEAHQGLSVQGTVVSSRAATLESAKGWLFGTLATGFVGAVIAAAMTSESRKPVND